MSKPLEILKKYWNYDAFRTPQEEIINSVLNKVDTFAIMPTGGGKSICFQVPAMLLDGICLVVSPLVALMKDQVENLQKRDIKAIALTGGIHQDEIINLLDNCQYGNYKFLYISPERLQNDWILDRIKTLPINLIAIDEAHCVSQWGHDFRPAYLKISSLKKHFTKIPFLALTASATQRVQDDVIVQLQLQDTAIFKKSFARENLAYMVFQTEDKGHYMQQILSKNKQPSIVYVNSRKACIDTVKQLEALSITATYYHGGLSLKEKENQMHLFMSEKVQVMVATNAFGMGIDKANVKTVIHLHLPQNLENYYQEAGRAGRNSQKAFAVLLTNANDIISAENQFLNVLPDKKFLQTVFIKLCNFFQIAYGEGIDCKFSFNINQFCTKYDLPMLKTYNALQFLDRQAIISFSQEFNEKISIQFIITSKEVIRYISLNPNDEEVLLTILRNYPGVYEAQTAINTTFVAKKSNVSEANVISILQKLKEKQIAETTLNTSDATIIFNEIREDEKTINRIAKHLENQNKLKATQFQSVLHYVNTNTCKSNLLLDYFDEKSNENCGICSYCISLQQNKVDIKTVEEKIIELLKKSSFTSRDIVKLTRINKDDIIFALQNLLEQEKIKININNTYSLQ